MSPTMQRPPLSLPTPKASREGFLRASWLSSTSRRGTTSTVSLGISMPTAALPGMGASMRMLGAAKLSAMSSASAVMRLTLMPGAG